MPVSEPSRSLIGCATSEIISLWSSKLTGIPVYAILFCVSRDSFNALDMAILSSGLTRLNISSVTAPTGSVIKDLLSP